MRIHKTLLVLTSLMLGISACKKSEVSEKGGGTTCECVGFVKNVLGITTSTANATDWGKTYSIPNYDRVYAPEVPDIIVMDAGYSWADVQYGHVGFVKSITYNKDGSMNIMVHGANKRSLQNSHYECGCDDVKAIEVRNITQSDIATGKIRFYRSQTSMVACSTFSLPFGTTSGNSSIRITGGCHAPVSCDGANTLPFLIENDGIGTLTVSGLEISNDVQNVFYFTNGLPSMPFTLNSGEKKSINITFAPFLSATSSTAALQVTSNASKGNSSFQLQSACEAGPQCLPGYSAAATTIGEWQGCIHNSPPYRWGVTYSTSFFRSRIKSFNTVSGDIVFEWDACNANDLSAISNSDKNVVVRILKNDLIPWKTAYFNQSTAKIMSGRITRDYALQDYDFYIVITTNGASNYYYGGRLTVNY